MCSVKSIDKFNESGLQECLSMAHLLMNTGWRMKFQNVALKGILSVIDGCFTKTCSLPTKTRLWRFMQLRNMISLPNIGLPTFDLSLNCVSVWSKQSLISILYYFVIIRCTAWKTYLQSLVIKISCCLFTEEEEHRHQQTFYTTHARTHARTHAHTHTHTHIHADTEKWWIRSLNYYLFHVKNHNIQIKIAWRPTFLLKHDVTNNVANDVTIQGSSIIQSHILWSNFNIKCILKAKKKIMHIVKQTQHDFTWLWNTSSWKYPGYVKSIFKPICFCYNGPKPVITGMIKERKTEGGRKKRGGGGGGAERNIWRRRKKTLGSSFTRFHIACTLLLLEENT